MPGHRQAQDVDLRDPLPSPLLRVLLVGLPPVYAHGLQAVLAAAGVGSVVADPSELPPLLAGPEPHVVVVPWAQVGALVPPGAVGVRPAVVALVEVAVLEVWAEALRAGVLGVITSADAPDDVVMVLRCAARGRAVLPQGVARGLCRPGVPAPPSLTSTEQAWMRRLASGGTVAGLARSCGYSEREMYRRLSTLYLRLGARTRTQALLLAERHGLLDEPAPAPDVIRLP